MWLFTRYGFYSAVCARRGNGEPGQPLDPARVMVRARLRDHLEALKARFPDLVGDCPVVASAGTDYAWRLFVDKGTWARVVSELADDIEYGNFKSAVASHQGAGGATYAHALSDVWEVMSDVQASDRRR